jgi:hypothetical protein
MTTSTKHEAGLVKFLPKPRARDIALAALLAMMQALMFVLCLKLTIQQYQRSLKAWRSFKSDVVRWLE